MTPDVVAEHGRRGYRNGCRCAICKADVAGKQAERRRILKASSVPFTHGTTGGYNNHSCRCAECTRAQREAVQEYRTRPLRKASS